MPSVPISLIICTRNRASALTRCLESVERMVVPCEWEFIVVDNGSTDATKAVISDFQARASFKVRYVFEGRPGLSRARNTGWKHSSGETVAFTDDDCYPERDFLQRVVETFTDSDVGIAGGRVLLHDPDDYPITIQTHPTRFSLPAYSSIAAGAIHGANMSVRRAILEACGGFDELMGAGTGIPSGEDLDFLNRATAAGFSGVYCPEIIVYHHHGRRLPLDIAKLNRAYAIGRGAYYAKALLDRSRRRRTASEWRGELRARFSRKLAHVPYLETAREIQGAALYVLMRALHGARFEPYKHSS